MTRNALTLTLPLVNQSSGDRHPLATLLTQSRIKRGLTVLATAKRAKITRAYLGDLEKYRRPGASDKILRRLASVLATPFDQLKEAATLQRIYAQEDKLQKMQIDAGMLQPEAKSA